MLGSKVFVVGVPVFTKTKGKNKLEKHAEVR